MERELGQTPEVLRIERIIWLLTFAVTPEGGSHASYHTLCPASGLQSPLLGTVHVLSFAL
jgi:hypothetical protein